MIAPSTTLTTASLARASIPFPEPEDARDVFAERDDLLGVPDPLFDEPARVPLDFDLLPPDDDLLPPPRDEPPDEAFAPVDLPDERDVEPLDDFEEEEPRERDALVPDDFAAEPALDDVDPDLAEAVLAEEVFALDEAVFPEVVFDFEAVDPLFEAPARVEDDADLAPVELPFDALDAPFALFDAPPFEALLLFEDDLLVAAFDEPVFDDVLLEEPLFDADEPALADDDAPRLLLTGEPLFDVDVLVGMCFLPQ